MAAIQHGRDPAWLAGWVRDASADLFGAAVSETGRAFAAGFERQALSLTAAHAEADQTLCVPRIPSTALTSRVAFPAVRP